MVTVLTAQDSIQYISPHGNSVAGYFLCTYDLVPQCWVEIVPRVESQHMHVLLHVMCQYQQLEEVTHRQFIAQYGWDPNRQLEYKDRINSDEGQRMLDEAYDSIDLSPDIAIKRFTDFLLFSAECMKTQVCVGGPARNTGSVWFDKECRDLKKKARKALRTYSRLHSDDDIETYCKARREYKAMLVEKKRNHNQSTCRVLLNNRNSTVFWKHVRNSARRKREQPRVKLGEWETHFCNVLTGQPVASAPQATPALGNLHIV
ncbi:hypothetical protein BaRGS_00023224 [Batillaria attramentaria]|uniref:Uncharacterized protein n=1 Tax=Batillaria attramentaria TaxID=370345 RepID=A0ABD0KEK4_9CAEN